MYFLEFEKKYLDLTKNKFTRDEIIPERRELYKKHLQPAT